MTDTVHLYCNVDGNSYITRDLNVKTRLIAFPSVNKIMYFNISSATSFIQTYIKYILSLVGCTSSFAGSELTEISKTTILCSYCFAAEQNKAWHMQRITETPFISSNCRWNKAGVYTSDCYLHFYFSERPRS